MARVHVCMAPCVRVVRVRSCRHGKEATGTACGLESRFAVGATGRQTSLKYIEFGDSCAVQALAAEPVQGASAHMDTH